MCVHSAAPSTSSRSLNTRPNICGKSRPQSEGYSCAHGICCEWQYQNKAIRGGCRSMPVITPRGFSFPSELIKFTHSLQQCLNFDPGRRTLSHAVGFRLLLVPQRQLEKGLSPFTKEEGEKSFHCKAGFTTYWVKI